MEAGSIKQLMNDPNIDIREIFTHGDLIFTIKNQDPVIKRIFTPPNIKLLLSYLNQEQELHLAQPSLSYKMPSAATDILCSQSHLLTDIIFQSELDDATIDQPNDLESKHLLEFLFRFFDYSQHYFLAGLFSKAVISLTKRVFSPTHKYNSLYCYKIFTQKSYLFKTCNHLYSQSMNELIVRWLTLKSRENSFKDQKERYLGNLLSLINLSQGDAPSFDIPNFGGQSLESVCNLVMLMLRSSLDALPERPQPQEHKNINLLVNKNSQKQLYELCCQNKYVSEILKPIPSPRIQKLTLIKKFIHLYRIQNEKIQKLDQGYKEIHLSQIINEEMLVQCLGWVHQLLISAAHQGRCRSNTESLPSKESNSNSLKFIVVYLEILHQFHLLLEELREPLTFFYESKDKQQVEVIVKLLRLKNDIIANLLSKIIVIILRDLQCPDFSTSLLHNGLSEIIDEEGIRQHVLPWAKIILERKNEREHIFQNPKQQAKWDHMAEVVAAAEDIVVGKFRFQPSNLNSFYALQKAKQYYQDFLSQPIVTEFEDKLGRKVEPVQSEQFPGQQNSRDLEEIQKKTHLPETPKDLSTYVGSIRIDKDTIVGMPGPEQQGMDVLGIDSIRQGYISYEIDEIIQQMEQ